MTTRSCIFAATFLMSTACFESGSGFDGDDEFNNDEFNNSESNNGESNNSEEPFNNSDQEPGCDEGAHVLGDDGEGWISYTTEVEVDSFEDGFSFGAEPVSVVLPEGVDGIGLTASAGSRETCWAAVWVDGGLVENMHCNEPNATVAFPYDESSQLRGRCLSMLPALVGDEEGTISIHIVAREQAPAEPYYRVNLVLVGELLVQPEELDEAMEQASELYLGAGAPFYEVERHTLDGPPSISHEDVGVLNEVRVGEDVLALNLFIIQSFTDVSLFGIAGGIPGPNGIPGTASSGVVVALEPHYLEDEEGEWALDTRELASTIAHELGHQLGLFHTTEEEGEAHDPISDTPECDTNGGEAIPSACPDGTNLMFWTSSEEDYNDEISDTQARVLAKNPATR
jgi:hypothetical protein